MLLDHGEAWTVTLNRPLHVHLFANPTVVGLSSSVVMLNLAAASGLTMVIESKDELPQSGKFEVVIRTVSLVTGGGMDQGAVIAIRPTGLIGKSKATF